ncbi:MAG TPA: DUF2752 domain-containing protein [Candidatus Thermoplasmatota archaeon]|nr:DUF2752 domain-containing protein [Candidatus Thermoplasmatota archaeon]
MGATVGSAPSFRPRRAAWGRLLEFVAFGTPRAIVVNLVSILAILAAWPTDRLHYLPVRSVWENVFHVKPYSSGMMRALSRLLHLDVEGAWDFNPLAFVALPVMVGLIGVNAGRWWKAAKAVRGASATSAPAPLS